MIIVKPQATLWSITPHAAQLIAKGLLQDACPEVFGE